MADPSLYSDAQKSADVQRAYQKAQQALQTLYEQWEAAEAAPVSGGSLISLQQKKESE